LKPWTVATNGTQRKISIGVAAAPKVGKTTFVDYCYVLQPYLQMEKLGRLDDIDWIYFSYEIDRINKEFKFAAFFMAYDHGVWNYIYKGKMYLMNQDYLMGKQLHKNVDGDSEIIPVAPEHEELLKIIYEKRIIPLFGEYAQDGSKLSKGKIDFIEEPENPTGLNKYLFRYAKANGNFVEENYTTFNDQHQPIIKKRIAGYTSNNDDKFSFIITRSCEKIKKRKRIFYERKY
jgi:hypothetical protein